MELTVLMPCLNEENTIAYCIEEASAVLRNSGISGEILVVDNGSLDNSVNIARKMGVRVITVDERGYGAALRQGILDSLGTYVICADADMSYNFKDILPIYGMLQKGNSLVVGNRFNAKMEKGAMPISHRYLGIPFLSWLGRLRYGVDVRDFHCGLRGMCRRDAETLTFQTTGMEFATEMIGAFARAKLPIAQVDIGFRKDMRPGKSHLRTIRDGCRHLFCLMFC